MYRQDSFFDLTLSGRIGLVCLSTVLFLLTFYVARRLLRKRPVWVSIPGALILFWLFVWLSPQVYYMYYRMIIEDLPLQWVIWSPEGPLETAKLLVFQGPHSLSAHSLGLLGWSLIAAPFLNVPTRHKNA